MDSRIETVDSSVQMTVRKADFTIKILRVETDDFMTTLRNKMMWGDKGINPFIFIILL